MFEIIDKTTHAESDSLIIMQCLYFFRLFDMGHTCCESTLNIDQTMNKWKSVFVITVCECEPHKDIFLSVIFLFNGFFFRLMQPMSIYVLPSIHIVVLHYGYYWQGWGYQIK